MQTTEQPNLTPIRNLFKATWRKALVSLLAFIGIVVLIFIIVAKVVLERDPNVIIAVLSFINILQILVSTFILIYILYVLIKAK